MFVLLRRTMSLKNFGCSNAGGQIATLLTLVMVAILIFILVTVNTGQMAIKATRTTNAVDAAALSLASQLASRANNQMAILKAQHGHHDCRYKDGPPPALCGKKRGILGTILAIILIIICIILQQYELLPLIVKGVLLNSIIWCAIFGAVGGAIGGYIVTGDLQGAAMGAIQGAVMGAMMGAAYGGPQMVGVIETADGILEGTIVSMGEVGEFATIIVDGVKMTGVLISHSAPMALSAGAAALTSLTAGSKLYSDVEAELSNAEQMAAAARALNGMPDYDRIREGVMLQVLAQLVDDPTKVKDIILDIDGDGKINDEISRFMMWWFWRSQIIKWLSNEIADLTEAFIKEDLNSFLGFLSGTIPPAEDEGLNIDFGDGNSFESSQRPSGAPADESMQGFFNRQEIEGQDGLLVALVRAIYTNDERGYKAYVENWWEPGPTKELLDLWMRGEGIYATISGEGEYCPACEEDDPSLIPDLPAFDEVDAAIMSLQNFIQRAAEFGFVSNNSTFGPNTPAGLSGALYRNWHSWLYVFYEPDQKDEEGNLTGEGRDDYYDQLGIIVGGSDAQGNLYYSEPFNKDEGDFRGMRRWLDDLRDYRDSLPSCNFNCDGVVPANLRDIIVNYIYSGTVFNLNSLKIDNYPCKYSWGIQAMIEQILVAIGADGLSQGIVNFVLNALGLGWLPEEIQENLEAEIRGVIESLGLDSGLVDQIAQGLSNGNVGEQIRRMLGSRNIAGAYAGTVDEDLEDEFTPVLGASMDDVSIGLPRVIGEVEGFRGECKGLYDTIALMYSPAYLITSLAEFTDSFTRWGVTPPDDLIETMRNLTSFSIFGYTWEDSRGVHNVDVEVGPFLLSEVKDKKHGNIFKGQNCLELRDYEDDDPPGDVTWVRVTETMPAGQEIKAGQMSLGEWNPDGSRSIVREAHAGYKYQPLPWPRMGQVVILGIVKSDRGNILKSEEK